MATQVQLRRGTTTEHASFTGAVGEVTVDITKDTLVVHDGSTVGGYPLARASDLSTMGGTMQPLDADLTAIAALSGTSGYLKKVAADTWSLDTNTYLTGNQSISISGDASGTGSTSITLTLANTAVTAGSYTYASLTVDGKGRVTAASNGTAPVTGVSGTAPIVSSGGTTPAISISAATTSAAGSMSSADKSKLDGIAAGAQVNVATDLSYTASTRLLESSTGTDVTLPLFSSTTAGLVGSSGGGTTNFLRADGTWSAAQPLDADLTAIAALAGTSGLLKKTAADTWSLDTSTYLTGNQSITFSGDATGSGTTSVSLTLANTAVTAGSYTNASITVDAKGRVTAASNGTAPVTSVAGTAPIVSSGGATPAISISAATTSAAGSMSASDKTKLDGIAAGAQVNVATDLSYTASTRLLASSTGADVTLPLFSSTEAGLTPLSGGGTTNFLRADGTWAAPAGGGGGGTPGGSTTQVQFNDSGSFGGDADFTWNKTTNVLGITGDVNLSDGGSFTTTLQTITPTAARTISLPDATGTVALITGSSGQVMYNLAGALAGSNLGISSGAFGYTAGGGTVTQATSKATGVTLNNVCGQVTMNAAALAADTTVTFTLTNSTIAATDVLILNHVSGGTAGSYLLNAQAAAGSAAINVRNITAASLSEAIVIRFAVIKSVTA